MIITCVCFGKGCVQGSPAAMRTGPEASKRKPETVPCTYRAGRPVCSHFHYDINKHYEVTWPKSADLIGWPTS